MVQNMHQGLLYYQKFSNGFVSNKQNKYLGLNLLKILKYYFSIGLQYTTNWKLG